MTPALQLAPWTSWSYKLDMNLALKFSCHASYKGVLTSSIGVSVRRYFGFVFLGGSRLLQCGDAKSLFAFAAALLRKVDLPMLSMQKRKFTA